MREKIMADFVKGVHPIRQASPLELSRELQDTENILQSHLDRIAELGKYSTDKKEEEMTQQSHSVDISIGYEELTRARLIGFLRKFRAEFQVMSVERGMYHHENMLRVYTLMGRELVQYIREHFPSGNDFRFVIHESEIATRGYKKFKPDTETKRCRKKFDL